MNYSSNQTVVGNPNPRSTKTKMENLNIKIDFSGITAATGGISILPAGMQMAVISEFVHYTDNGSVLYAYMNTDGMRHRERYDLNNENALRYLKSFLMSAGVAEAKVSSEEEIPFHKFVGRTVYFNYVPPQVGEDGKAVSGSYPKYTFYSKDRFESMAQAMSSSEDVAPPNGKKQEKSGSSDEFEYLLS
tara:strand:+ start:109 stop:675 length:567 start_codon:yes stop_codon:yes gene_type:complete